MFKRELGKEIIESVKAFYAVSIVGPRQSGKTTLLRHLFQNYIYINLEDPDTLQRVKDDPRGFFQDPKLKWIIDEAQEYPELFSFLLGFIDRNKVLGQFILSGSKNFILLEKISESLAGRVAVVELLPLHYYELATYGKYIKENIWNLIYKGSYPGPYYNEIRTDLWYKSYLTTYIQRDVRQIMRVKDLSKFNIFLKLCAGRHGQIINLSEIGSACGVSHTTIGEWLNLLELSYIIFRLQPYYKNFSKRIIKNSKLYFYDSGLVAYLLGIENPEHAKFHSSRGALFEGYVISEVMKYYLSKAKTPNLYFWNSHKGFEIDLLIEQGDRLSAVEIKSSSTYSRSFLQQLNKWQELNKITANSSCFIVYAGEGSFIVNNKNVLSYRELKQLVYHVTK